MFSGSAWQRCNTTMSSRRLTTYHQRPNDVCFRRILNLPTCKYFSPPSNPKCSISSLPAKKSMPIMSVHTLEIKQQIFFKEIVSHLFRARQWIPWQVEHPLILVHPPSYSIGGWTLGTRVTQVISRIQQPTQYFWMELQSGRLFSPRLYSQKGQTNQQWLCEHPNPMPHPKAFQKIQLARIHNP